jgi:uncharacterized Zn finger protein
MNISSIIKVALRATRKTAPLKSVIIHDFENMHERTIKVNNEYYLVSRYKDEPMSEARVNKRKVL